MFWIRAFAQEPLAQVAVASTWLTVLHQVFGIEIGVATAAALGAVGSLAFLRALDARQSIASVALGFACGTYGAVPALGYLHLPPDWKYFAALLLGLVGFNLIGGAVQLSRRFRQNPVDTAREFRKP